MDPGQWARMKEIFQAARECEPAEREARVRELCAGDDALRAAVNGMLAREPDAAGFLESPALDVEAMAIARDSGRGAPTSEATRLAVPPAGLPEPSVRPTWWIVALAAVFLADLLLRSWGYVLGPVGFGMSTRLENGAQVIVELAPGGPAQLAGMRVGDVLVARDGQPLPRVPNRRAARANLEVGRAYRFDLERNGQPMHATIELPASRMPRDLYGFVVMLWQVAGFALLATGVLIGFVRPRDPVALTGALTLASLSVGLWLFNLPPGYAAAWRHAPLGLGTLLWIPNLCVALVGPIGLSFFVRFPRPLFQARWIWMLLWLPALLLLPFQMRSLFLIVYRPVETYARPAAGWTDTAGAILFAAYGIAMLAAITANYVRLVDPGERRRLRVLVAGGAAGTLPALARIVVMNAAPNSSLNEILMSPVPDALIVALFLLFPISFAYAVLKHRLLGIRVIIRMGLQYALARGLVLSLVPLLGLVLAADALVHAEQPLQDILTARGWTYALLGAIAVGIHTQRHRWSAAIDRRFFRDQYDASHLLREVADQARRARSLQRAGPAVVARIEAALHPEFAGLLFRSTGEARFRCIASAPVGHVPPPIASNGTLAARLRAVDEPLELTGPDAERAGKWTTGLEPDELRRARVELLIPIVMGSERHEAILALGPKRSEEPYTREDLEALEAIASSLALLAEGATPPPDRMTGTLEECPLCGTCYDTGVAQCRKEHAPLVAVRIPRTLGGRYRLEQRLGQGGMGTVYEATDVALDRRVAVKVVRDEWVHNAMATQRFRREAKAVAGFAHPNVVTVYDYGVETGARVFLVMELLDGTTLRDELRRGGRLGAARTLDVLRGVCSAVDAAHQRGFIHRDLKPENIFLVAGNGPVKVLDFGVVKPLVEVQATSPGGQPETEVGVLVGTVGYISPEQLLGDSPDVSWDVWALTVVAYEALTAALPFPVASREAWRQLVLSARFRPLADHLDDAPAQWQAFFDRSFAVDRRVRPRTAADFCRQLERALA